MLLPPGNTWSPADTGTIDVLIATPSIGFEFRLVVPAPSPTSPNVACSGRPYRNFT